MANWRETEYALEGSVFIGGAVVQWLRDSLVIIEKSSDVKRWQTPSKTTAEFILSGIAGLGAPHWNQDARAD